MKPHLKSAFLIMAFAVSSNIYAQDKRVTRIDSLMSVLEANQLFNGSILVADHGKIIYRRAVGELDNGLHIPNSDNVNFNLASLAKPFTAVAVLQLVEKGRIKLDDPVQKYLKQFPYPGITIKHLLQQTSGLPSLEQSEDNYIKAHPGQVLTNTDIYEHLAAAKKPLQSTPGTTWNYNNGNYVFLALVVEQVSRKPFASYMQQNIFRPAGMMHSYIRAANAANTPRYIIPTFYTSAYQPVDSLDRNLYYTYYNAGGLYGPNNVISTLQDLVKFDRTLFAGKLISKKTLKMAMMPLKFNNGDEFHMGRSTRSYGMGWNVYATRTTNPDSLIFHDGHITGLGTVLQHNISKDQTVMLFDNRDHNPIQLMVSVTNILSGLPPIAYRTTKSAARAYGQLLVTRGADAAISKLRTLVSDSTHYYFDELEMNNLGMDLMLKARFPHHMELCLETFKLNTIFFPKSGNAYDSYATALEKVGDKDSAILMYERSLAYWPNNENAKTSLLRLKMP
jgi:CubicO group peptidase (beta-lactamase class C family)